jgi:hypothetical protein
MSRAGYHRETCVAEQEQKIVEYKGYRLTGSAQRGRSGKWFGMVTIDRYSQIQRELMAHDAATRLLAVEGAISYAKEMVDGSRCGLRV